MKKRVTKRGSKRALKDLGLRSDGAVKDLPQVPKAKDVKGGATPTRFDPYKNFKF